MPKKNGKLYAAEARALAYMETPLADGALQRRRKPCACSVNLYIGREGFETLEEIRQAMKKDSVVSVVKWCVNYALLHLPGHIQAEKDSRYREHVKRELERARKAGYELPEACICVR